MAEIALPEYTAPSSSAAYGAASRGVYGSLQDVVDDEDEDDEDDNPF